MPEAKPLATDRALPSPETIEDEMYVAYLSCLAIACEVLMATAKPKTAVTLRPSRVTLRFSMIVDLAARHVFTFVAAALLSEAKSLQ
jgi:hypothetical protein